VYALANSNDLPGGYLQNIFFDGDNAYIISGGSNVINVVNRYTFKLIAKIKTGLANPRYGVAKDGKAYVTNANTYSFENPATGNTDDYVAVINLATNTVDTKITLNTTANRIVLENGKLYITEPNNNDKLLVINPSTNALETPVTIGTNCDSMDVKDGILYILRNPSLGRSEIVKVKLSDKSVTRITFPKSLDGAANLDIEDSKIYYTVKNSVYTMSTSATEATTTAILTSTLPGYISGFAVHNNHIYIADGGNFGSDSKAYIYSLNGALEKELMVGVGPNGFYFNN
jgi:hypothetical protein